MGDSGARLVAVCELGSLGVRVDGRFEPVRGLRGRHVLALLSVAGGVGVRTDVLVESAWAAGGAPRSARMSLANIVSRFRAAYGHEFIESTGDGYRLGVGVDSDRRRFVASIDQAASLVDAEPERALAIIDKVMSGWRGEPWAGLDLGSVDADRTFLFSVAARGREVSGHALMGLGRRFEAIVVFERLVEADPLNEFSWVELAEALQKAGRRAEALRTVARARVALAAHGLTPGPQLIELERDIRNKSADSGQSAQGGAQLISNGVWSRSAVQLEVLHTCSSCWLRGDTDAAVDALMAGAEQFEADVVRRLGRCLTAIPPGEPLARQLWVFMMHEWRSLPEAAARSLVSNDARALELAGPAGLATADAEIELAVTQADLVRALRVRFMVGLGYPLDGSQLETVRRLGGVDAAHAAVEAARFEAIIKIKQGEMRQATEHLHQYAAVVADAWPTNDDDFATMALHILAMHPDRDELGISKPSGSRFPVFTADAMAARVSQAWHGTPRSATEQSVPYGFLQVLDTVTADCAVAIHLRWHLRTNRLDDAAKCARQLLERLDVMPRDRWFHAVPAALGEYAIRTEDSRLAAIVAKVVEPWSGEVLGLWPCDAIIGPADRLLDELASVP